MREDYWYSNRQRERRKKKGGCRKIERGRVRRKREKREKEMLWDLFFSLAPGTYIKMLILVFFVSFYNSLHFVPLSLSLSAPLLHLSHFCTFLSSSPFPLYCHGPPSQISAPGKRIPTLILWYFRWLGSEIGQKCTEFGAIRGILCRALWDWLVELPSTSPHITTQPAVVYLRRLTFVFVLLTVVSLCACVCVCQRLDKP